MPPLAIAGVATGLLRHWCDNHGSDLWFSSLSEKAAVRLAEYGLFQVKPKIVAKVWIRSTCILSCKALRNRKTTFFVTADKMQPNIRSICRSSCLADTRHRNRRKKLLLSAVLVRYDARQGIAQRLLL